MRHRHLPLLLILLAFVAGVLLLTWWRFSAHSPQKTAHCESYSCPNIVLVILDDMPWSHFGFLSKKKSVTPHLDKMAEQGFVFRNVYNTSSRCRASLATYLTGQLPHQNLIYANQGVLKLHDEQALIPILSQAGYASFAGGKMWEGSPEQLRLAAHDLDTFHFVRKSQEKLADFLDRYGHKQPIFIWWAPLLPHKHHNAPERFFERVDLSTITVPEGFPEEEKDTYRRAEQAFLATIAWVDEEVGKLIQSLEDQGLMDNTWILVLSDNGWSNLYPAKGAPYDIGVRTPLILQGPDVEPGISDKLVSTQNLYGSILQLAGLEVAGNRKETLDIFSVAKQHKNDALLNTPNQVYWASYPSYTGKSEPHPRAGRDVYALSLRQDNWQYTFYIKSFLEIGDEQAKAPAIVHTGWNSGYNHQSGDEELFDLSKDPFSEKNLSEKSASLPIVLELRRKVFDWWKRTGGMEIDSLKNCKNTVSVACDKYRQVYPVSFQ